MEIRHKLDLRDRTLVSVLAYSGPRPGEVVCRLRWDDTGERAIRYRGTKKGGKVRFTPLLELLADDLRGWFLASGRRRRARFPDAARQFLAQDRLGQLATACVAGRAGAQARALHPPGDNRLRAGQNPTAGFPLELHHRPGVRRRAAHHDRQAVRRRVMMIEKHYAGMIENWDGRQVAADVQIRTGREAGGRSMDALANTRTR